MKKKNLINGANIYYVKEGKDYVSNQILDSYNCGVIDQIEGYKKDIENGETEE